ncbi:MAG: hypothetical protein IJ769_11015 [Clostridia bacterium]|nr:hypothetical protein [Clostridia bacterium]
MNIRRMLAALLIAALLLTAVALAEDEFGFDFDDEGYTGTWVDIPALGVEFCLPDGWTQTEAGEDAAFAAAKDDGGAALAVRVEAENVEDVLDWAEANLSNYGIDTAGFFDTLYVESDDAISIYRLNYEDQLMAFGFARESAAALSLEFALEIVESVSEGWYDDYELYGGEDGADALADIQALENAGD